MKANDVGAVRIIPRHHGMDWLRIGAFALLILYHIGMVFVPWNFHVKSSPVQNWVVLPMLALNPWRLGLLFVVSGYASRALLTRSSGIGGFARNRTLRLIVPLLFGMAVIVPPQPWVELVVKHGFTKPFLNFWVSDYFGFAPLYGILLPTWNHLWFVVYLWVYTMALAALLAVVPGKRIQGAFDRLFGSWLLLALPLAWLMLVHIWWLPFVGETHTLFDDTIAHLLYVPAFLFGFALAGSPGVFDAIRRWWKLAAAMAVAAYAFKFGIEVIWFGNVPMPRALVPWYLGAHAVQQWCAIVALIGVADRFWNHNHRWRPMLTEAVFPFYIIHQTIIVVVMFWLFSLGLPGWAEFAITVAATVAGCWLFYLGGREIGWLRPLIGLRSRAKAVPVAADVRVQA